ncbi:MAG: hypothetical protein JJLCMIEE_01373 [Acidimicrobiales bacterium]|nr:MAG: hypothetical protein EDR02_17395 [Actinomycetota bacterium]MBV6508313.1 hypothetical protein [Acidimicrobiales bacterium]RIK07095.1 MAG: hypothetical protein DCC48_04700 [Acidobacteriota bacterium]
MPGANTSTWITGIEERRQKLSEIVERTRPVTLAGERVLPVLPSLRTLFPDGGLLRGSTVAVDGGCGATSLALAVTAAASRAGSWVAVVGLSDLGLAAVGELGVDLHRIAVITPIRSSWATVVAALIDAFDLVVVAPSHAVRATQARRLAARARERGTVLLNVPGRLQDRARRWPEEVDLRLTVSAVAWEGLARGYGHLRTRRLTVQATGRRKASRPRRADLWLVDADEGVISMEPPREQESSRDPEVAPLRRVG